MKKSTALFLAVGGILVMVGAGCNPEIENTTPTDETQTTVPGDQTTPPTDTQQTNEPGQSTSASTEAAEGFTVTAEQTEKGVSVNWTVPEGASTGSSWRVLNSARPDPTYSSNPEPGSFNPYWNQYMNSVHSAVITNAPKGTRYFRVCEYNLTTEECVKYSNVVTVEVE